MWFIQLLENYRENCSTSIPEKLAMLLCNGKIFQHCVNLGLDFKNAGAFLHGSCCCYARKNTSGVSLSFGVTSHRESQGQVRVEGSLANREQVIKTNKLISTLFHSSLSVSNLYLTRICTASIKSRAVRCGSYFQGTSSQ